MILTIIGLLNGGVLVALIRNKPLMAKLKNERESTIDGVRTQDMVDMRKRIGDLETKVEKANDAAVLARDATTVVQMQMVSMQAAFELVAGELERNDPDNMMLKQARRLLAQAATRDMGVGVGMQKLATIPAAERHRKDKPA